MLQLKNIDEDRTETEKNAVIEQQNVIYFMHHRITRLLVLAIAEYHLKKLGFYIQSMACSILMEVGEKGPLILQSLSTRVVL